MPKAIARPTEKLSRLEKFDSEGDTTVTIRQATQREHALVAELFSESSRVYDQDEAGRRVEIKTRISREALKRRMVYVTLVDSNLLAYDGKEMLFKFRKNSLGLQEFAGDEIDFDEKWGLLPVDVSDEIYAKVLEVNPLWGNQGN